ncbi:MAG TPA: hypothetical protein VK828_03315 [Terriglobales bacterium]|jgi:hypothetical protein|nr:hypothetical protein [Terriglobales bacterium]
MDADFSVELGHDDPVLDFPWTDPAGKLAYLDVKRHPELLSQIEEAERFPELRDFLRSVNSPRSAIETAKCDAWASTELTLEEEIYDASHKFASYVDIVFSTHSESPSPHQPPPDRPRLDRQSLSDHQQFATNLVSLLRRAPETPSPVEICIRRCYFAELGGVRDGFYCTVYVSGYGSDEASARQAWGVGLKLTGNAILQISATSRGRS